MLASLLARVADGLQAIAVRVAHERGENGMQRLSVRRFTQGDAETNLAVGLVPVFG
jgi:hypothetical protein